METVNPEQKRVVINVMPSQELLEEFVGGMVVGHSTVFFDYDKGEFVRRGEHDA